MHPYGNPPRLKRRRAEHDLLARVRNHHEPNRLAGNTLDRGDDLVAMAERHAAFDDDDPAGADHERYVDDAPQIRRCDFARLSHQGVDTGRHQHGCRRCGERQANGACNPAGTQPANEPEDITRARAMDIVRRAFETVRFLNIAVMNGNPVLVKSATFG